MIFPVEKEAADQAQAVRVRKSRGDHGEKSFPPGKIEEIADTPTRKDMRLDVHGCPSPARNRLSLNTGESPVKFRVKPRLLTKKFIGKTCYFLN